jgi:hypothetical protein
MKAISKFVEAYRSMWEKVINSRADVEELADFFHVPCLIFDANGVMTEYRAAQEITAFNVTRRDSFRSGGAIAAKLQGVDCTSMGPHLSLAIVNWDLKRSDGSQERCWRHYYTIRDSTEGLKIIISTFDLGS